MGMKARAERGQGRSARRNRRLVVGEASDLTFEAVRSGTCSRGTCLRALQGAAAPRAAPPRQVQFRNPDVLRGMDLQKLLSGAGSVLSSNLGTAETYDFSEPADSRRGLDVSHIFFF